VDIGGLFGSGGGIQSLNGSIIIKVGTGNIIGGSASEIEAYQGVTLETVKQGDINVGIVTAQTGSVDISAQNGHVEAGKIEAGTDLANLQADGGNVSLAATGTTEYTADNSYDPDNPGYIAVSEIIAAKDVMAHAEDGFIEIGTVTGTNLWFGIDENGHAVEIGTASARESLFAQGEYVDITQINHTPTADPENYYFQLHLRGAGGDQAMTNVNLPAVNSPTGVQLDQLWTEGGTVNVNSEYFRIMEAYAIDKAYLRNSRYRMTLFGRNPAPDGRDIQIYFVPTPGNPFSRISFQNEFSYLGLENYKILWARDGVVNVVTNQRSLTDDMAIVLRTDERLAEHGYAGIWLAGSVKDYGRYLSLAYDNLDVMPLDGIYRGGSKMYMGRQNNSVVLYYDDAEDGKNWQILDEKRKVL
jgi:hypothetical protein